MSSKMSQSTQFDFGENWKRFSDEALTPGRVTQARLDFASLFADVPVTGQHFLDIGFGQGLSLLTASALGAIAVGCDINPTCAFVLEDNLRHFPELTTAPKAIVGSILDPTVVSMLRSLGRGDGTYEIVHSWGALHHTGDLATSIRNAADLVAPGGYLVVAIYNRHWSSSAWAFIKWSYVKAPHWGRRLAVLILYPIIYVAKWAVTRRNPKLQERGMDFYFNVIDWVGGYPYEYATVDEIVGRAAIHSLKLVRVNTALVPTGCNEFLFKKDI